MKFHMSLKRNNGTSSIIYDFGKEENNCAEIFILFNGQECEAISDSSGLENNKKYGQIEY